MVIDAPGPLQQSAHSNRKRVETRRRELIVVVEFNNNITDIDESETDKPPIPSDLINQASLVSLETPPVSFGQMNTSPEMRDQSRDEIQFMPPINPYFRIENK